MLCQYSSTFIIILIIANVATGGSRQPRQSGNNGDQNVKGQLMSVRSNEVNDKSSTIKMKNKEVNINPRDSKEENNMFSDYNYVPGLKETSKEDISFNQVANNVQKKESMIHTTESIKEMTKTKYGTKSTSKMIKPSRTFINRLGSSIATASLRDTNFVSEAKSTTKSTTKTNQYTTSSQTSFILPITMQITSKVTIKQYERNSFPLKDRYRSSTTESKKFKDKKVTSHFNTKSFLITEKSNLKQYYTSIMTENKDTSSKEHEIIPNNHSTSTYVGEKISSNTSFTLHNKTIAKTASNIFITKEMLKDDTIPSSSKEIYTSTKYRNKTTPPSKSTIYPRETSSNNISSKILNNIVSDNTRVPYSSKKFLNDITTPSLRQQILRTSTLLFSNSTSYTRIVNSKNKSGSIINNRMKKVSLNDTEGFNLDNTFEKIQDTVPPNNNTSTFTNNASFLNDLSTIFATKESKKVKESNLLESLYYITKDENETSTTKDYMKDLNISSTTKHYIKDLNRSSTTKDFMKDLNRSSTTEDYMKDFNISSTTKDYIKDLNRSSTTKDYIENFNKSSTTENYMEDLNKSSTTEDYMKDLNKSSSTENYMEDLNKSSSFLHTEIIYTPSDLQLTTSPLNISQSRDTLTMTPLNTFKPEKFRPMSPQRVEYNEHDMKDILWPCPPDRDADDNTFIWYKLSNNTDAFVPFNGTIHPQSNTLEIKNPSSTDEGRYVCLSRHKAPFTSSILYIYQFIILKEKWIDVGSSKNVSVYFNQNLILNCPHGDIKKDGIKHISPCTARITLMEQYPNTTQNVYSCTDFSNETIKLLATNSSSNCSLSLAGCLPKEDKYNIINMDRCIPPPNNQVHSSRVETCPGKIFIRFRYNVMTGSCLPFQTDLCINDYYTFLSLTECEHHCSIILKDIQTCFYPQNIDNDKSCADPTDGVYLTSYNIGSDECEWFYHRKKCIISKNAFNSLTICRQVCIQNRKLIKMEMPKACSFNFSRTSSTSSLIQRWVFIANMNDCFQKDISVTGEPFVMSFTSKTGCLMCKTMTTTDICLTKPRNGRCEREKIKWHFNSAEGRCIRILDGGCGESLNRFASNRDCMKMCSRFMTSRDRNSLETTTRTTTNIINTKKNLFLTTLNKRMNREIQNFQESLVIRTTPSSHVTVTPRVFDVSKRILDSDPCMGKALLGSCDYGFNKQNYTLVRYTFVPEYGECHRVLYSGCMGGENLFEDVNDCKASCEHRLYYSLKSNKCQSPYTNGCFSHANDNDPHVHRFYYSSAENQCLPFSSFNSKQCLDIFFSSKKDCFKVCRPKPPSEALLQNKCYGKMVIDESTCTGNQMIHLWFYMSIIKQCLQYSTCPVQLEGNVFLKKSDCEESCQATNIFTVCNLPQDPGMGLKSKTKLKYFYDNQRRKCSVFGYRGSMGNLNRFRSNEECSNVCSKVMLEMNYESHSSAVVDNLQNVNFDYQGTLTSVLDFNLDSDREYCFDAIKFGACSQYNAQVFITKYYYNAHQRQCEPYFYSGCGAISKNSFDSAAICDKMCTSRMQKTASSVCSRRIPRCSNSTWIYWVYNTERGLCDLFPSCIQQSSNELFFTDEESCSRICVPSLPQKKDLFDVCHLPKTISQSCSLPSTRWFYDENTGSCDFFTSCDSYGNNFASLSSCQHACVPQDLQDVCKLPEDSGPCSSNNTFYYFFHWKSQRCLTFSYGGCLGNRNRFVSLHDCQATCPAKNKCHIHTRNTNCKVTMENSTAMFLYSSSENTCKKINETLCGNYFDFHTSLAQCNNDCVIRDDFKSIAFSYNKKISKLRNSRCEENVRFNSYQICSKSQEWLPRFFYDKGKQECTFFYYNGCDGSEDRGNRFFSFELCRDTCYKVTESTTLTSTTISTTATMNHVEGKNKVCPKPHHSCSSLAFTNKSCKIDSDCNIDMKCCACDLDGSFTTQCIEAVGCMLSSFGCCSGTEHIATDLLHINCSKSPPRFVQSPEIIKMKANDTTLRVEYFLTGDPRPNIHWIHLDSKLVEKESIITEPRWDLIQPLWSSVITLNVSSNILGGLWLCRGSNEIGQDDIEFMISPSLKTLEPTLFMYDHHNVNSTVKYVTLHGNTNLHCPIYGLPRPSIKWFHNGSAIDRNNEHIRLQGRFIFFTHIPFSYEGLWTCIAEQSKRSLRFKVKLTIREPLQILPSPHGNVIRAVIGQKVILFCNVVDKPIPNITWMMRRDDVVRKVVSSENDDRRIFVLSNFKYEERGEYMCKAKNNVSEDNMSFFVTVVEASDIVVEPAGFHFIGDHITMHCPAKPATKLQHVLWKKDNVYMKTGGVKLNFILHSKLDSGFYTCHHGGRSYTTHIYVYIKSFL